jgi:hypothetical protein
MLVEKQRIFLNPYKMESCAWLKEKWLSGITETKMPASSQIKK